MQLLIIIDQQNNITQNMQQFSKIIPNRLTVTLKLTSADFDHTTYSTREKVGEFNKTLFKFLLIKQKLLTV